VATDAMFVLVAKKIACARLRDMLHQKLCTMLLAVVTPAGPKRCAQWCIVCPPHQICNRFTQLMCSFARANLTEFDLNKVIFMRL